MLLFANIFYGFPFIQKIFEEEKIYMNDSCSPGNPKQSCKFETASFR